MAEAPLFAGLLCVALALTTIHPASAREITPIITVEDLQNIRNDLSGNYYLANDIDASETAGWNNGAGFAPIGTGTNKFIGSFDGRGYSAWDFLGNPYEYFENNDIRSIDLNINSGYPFLVCLAGLKASVKINQIYINTFSGDGPQFIKLYNPTDMDIDMSGWKVVDDRGGVNITIPAGTVIRANHYYLIAGEGWSENRDNLDWSLADLEVRMNMNLTDSGIQLVDADNEVVDAVGWGSPPEGFYEGTPLPNPDIGSSYKRKQGSWDTNNNSEDFLRIEFLHIIVTPLRVAGLILMPFISLGTLLAVLWFQNRRYDRG